MARISRPLATLLLAVLLSCSGCATWHYRKETSPDDGASYGNHNEVPLLIQSLQNASLNDWNFGRSGGIWF